jgi:hypothetical protein
VGLKIGLLLGEVNLSDKYNIQLDSTNFTISLNLNPLPESELSLLQMFDRVEDDATATVERLTRELKMEALTIGNPIPTSVSSQPVSPADLYPSVPLAYNRSSAFTHPDIVPVESSPNDRIFNPEPAAQSMPSLPTPAARFSLPTPTDITGDLEIDFADLTVVDRSHDPHNYPNLEIVIDD